MRLAGTLRDAQDRMQTVHILHDIGDGPVDAGSRQLELDPAQIRHRHDTGKKMASDLTVRPMPNRAYAHQIIVLA
jgi:hypothetical protein